MLRREIGHGLSDAGIQLLIVFDQAIHPPDDEEPLVEASARVF